ncbi:MAG: hypothetical protein NZ926_01015 [Candidatus Methanomethylicia archaeon]|nr:hypothetical protein [Candidatus Methanomethylicia archaeon]MCX8169011.1 hypothetical protein [Candidatus Methanomethylicia archaeon]MDW7988743.1 RNA-binding domain-containing protein [Nitrososphaerota archaeon]
MVVKVIVSVEVKPTENEEKVKKTLLNILNVNVEKIKLREDDKVTLIVEGGGFELLLKFREVIRRRRILSAAKAILKQSIIDGNKIIFYLNKQAAYMGQVSFCQRDGESPLGPITIEVICENEKEVNEFINWLTSQS